MKILYVSQFYYPENIAGAFRATDHSSYWAKLGHEVTVLTGWPNYPTGKLFPGYTMKLLDESCFQGVRVIRSKEHIGANTSLFKRALSMLSFYLYGLYNFTTKRKTIGDDYDVVIASSGPIFAASLGKSIAKSIRRPFVVEFRDITYVQLMATGHNERSEKVQVIKKLEIGLCNKANDIIVVTNGLKATLVSDGISAERIHVIPNGADVVELESNRHGKGIVLGYFGTIGLSQDVMQTVRCMSELKKSGIPLKYMIIGEGAERELVESYAESDETGWFSLIHGVSKEELEPFYQRVDMTVVSLVDSPDFSSSIPSKIFQSLARGVPVVFFGPKGEASQLIDENEVGIILCGESEENQAKLKKFFSAKDYESKLADMRENAINLMNQSYSRKRMAEEVIEVLERAHSNSVC